MRNMLYYPTILIPSDWMKKSILYCDKLSSIYPYGISPVEGILESQALSEMNHLKSEGMYSYSRPENLNDTDFENILQDLQMRIPEAKLKKLQVNFTTNNCKYEIYKSKLDYDIIQYLISEGLAADSGIGNSLLVEKEVALTYMSLLSAFSSNLENQYISATDSEVYKNILYPSSEDLVSKNSMSIILNKLPSPDISNSMEDIIYFKKKHNSDLLHFRRFLSEWTHKLYENPSVEVLNTFDDEFDRYTIEFNKIFKSERMNCILDSFEIVLPYSISTAYTLNSIAPDIDSIAIGGISTVASVLTHGVRNIFGKEKSSNPLTYINRARRDNII